MEPKVYSAKKHPIRNGAISKNSLSVINRLNSAGYDAYLVGGGVRDLLLGLSPKDFDIVTNAHPSEIRNEFRNCRIIGRRFRLAHILFGREIIEVATFRANEVDEESKHFQTNRDGFITRDNIYGTIDEDALRRDFTINALYYDVRNQSIIDYCDGVRDIEARKIRLIGDPAERFHEDPVRIIRAIRFEAKLGFSIDSKLLKPIAEYAHLLHLVSPSRMYDEVLKLFLTGHGVDSFKRLMHYNIFEILFPDTFAALKAVGFPEDHLLVRSLNNSDERSRAGLTSSPYFVYASLLWAPFVERYETLLAEGVRSHEASRIAAEQIFKAQNQITVIPRYVREFIEELWIFQFRLLAKTIRNPQRQIEHSRFKAAYDFLLLRAEANESEEVVERAAFWKKEWEAYERANPDREEAGSERGRRGNRSKSRPRRRPRRRRRQPPKES